MVTHLLALLLVGQVSAPDGKEAFERGRRAYNLGEWRAASEAFAECYRIAGLPVCLFDVAQAERQAGNAKAAVAAYKGYLRDEPTAPNRTQVEAWIRELQEAAPSAPPPSVKKAELQDPFMLPLDHEPPPAPPPVYTRWWFWTAVGLGLLAGTAGLYAATRGPEVPTTPLGNKRL